MNEKLDKYKEKIKIIFEANERPDISNYLIFVLNLNQKSIIEAADKMAQDGLYNEDKALLEACTAVCRKYLEDKMKTNIAEEIVEVIKENTKDLFTEVSHKQK